MNNQPTIDQCKKISARNTTFGPVQEQTNTKASTKMQQMIYKT